MRLSSNFPSRSTVRAVWHAYCITILGGIAFLFLMLWMHQLSTRQSAWNTAFDACEAQLVTSTVPIPSDSLVATICSALASAHVRSSSR